MKINFLGREREGIIGQYFRWLFDLTGWQWTRHIGWHPLVAGERIEAGTLVYVDGDHVYGVKPDQSPAIPGIAITSGDKPIVVTDG